MYYPQYMQQQPQQAAPAPDYGKTTTVYTENVSVPSNEDHGPYP